jgi:hypothetical protein
MAVTRRDGTTESIERNYGKRERHEIRACAIADTLDLLLTVISDR